MPRVAQDNEQSQDPADSAAAQTHSADIDTLRWALPILVAALVLATFSPALRNGFVNWDDDINLLENGGFRGLATENLRWMFTTQLGGHYHPLTWLSFAVDHAIWGPPNRHTAFGYHLTNILLHAAAAAFFVLIARRLLRAGFGLSKGFYEVESYWCAALAALIFAVHPLRVESVAWVTERRDVLSAVFLFAAVLVYLRAAERRSGYAVPIALACLLYAMSLLSKASGMTLPLVLFVIDIYPLRRLTRKTASLRRIIIEKIPFALLAAASAVTAARAQQAAETWRTIEQFSISQRIATAAYSCVFYVLKLISPTHLAPLYPIPQKADLLGATFVVCLIVIAGAVTLAVIYRRRFPAGLAVLTCYALLLAPVSGLAQSGRQFVADRYSYLSLLPFAVLAAAGLFMLWTRRGRDDQGRPVVRTFQVLAGLFVLGIGALSAAQTTQWRDSVTLWTWAVQATPNNAVGVVNLADAFRETGEIEKAASAYAQAIQLDPTDPKAINGLGVTLLQLNKPADARPFLEEAVKLEPNNPGYRCNLGYLLGGFGQLEQAAQQYQRAIDIAPNLIHAYLQRAELLIRLERFADARDLLTEGLRRRPNHRGLRGKLAWLLATCRDDSVRDPQRALELATSLCEQDGYQDPVTLDILAAAWAQAGDFEKATDYARMARDTIEPQQKPELAADIEKRLSKYKNREPHIE